jgi:hypothetical protein
VSLALQRLILVPNTVVFNAAPSSSSGPDIQNNSSHLFTLELVDRAFDRSPNGVCILPNGLRLNILPWTTTAEFINDDMNLETAKICTTARLYHWELQWMPNFHYPLSAGKDNWSPCNRLLCRLRSSSILSDGMFLHGSKSESYSVILLVHRTVSPFLNTESSKESK